MTILVVRLVAVDGLQQQRRIGLERFGAELLAIVEVEHGRLDVQAQAGTLPSKRRLMPSSGCTLTTRRFGRGRMSPPSTLWNSCGPGLKLRRTG